MLWMFGQSLPRFSGAGTYGVHDLLRGTLGELRVGIVLGVLGEFVVLEGELESC